MIYEIDQLDAKHITAVDGRETLSPHDPTGAAQGHGKGRVNA
ncbi:hypothetical protein [Bradyrhizobium sp. CCBAU 51753]|nr:hypothetical protein [Bradyrhizobium sp. CCBAU 51753]